MTTRSGRREHDHVRRREDRRAVRPAAGPDDRLQGAQGRPDRQHPGRARGRREDRGQAHPRVRRPRQRCYARIDEVKPDKLRDKLREHRDQIFMGKELSTIVRDLPIEFDLEAARLGDYDRDTVVRLFREYEFRTLIERLPPMAGETAEERPRSLRAVVESGYVPGGPRRRAGPTAGARARHDRRDPSEGGELQLSPRLRRRWRAAGRGRRARRRCRRTAADGDGQPAPRRRVRAEPGDLPSRPGRRDRRPDRGSRSAAGDRIAELEPWIAAQPAVGVALVARRPAPAPRARRSPSRSPGADGRVVAAEGAEATPTPSASCSSGCGVPLVGHEVKPLLVARFADDPRGAGRPRSRSTPRSPPTSSTPRCAARRSPTSWPRHLDQILPPATELAATARAGLEALSALAVREPLERRLADDEPGPAVSATSSCR